MKDLKSSIILGAATGYSPDKVEIFLESLFHAKYKGKVVLFINDDQYKDYCTYYSKKAYEFELEFTLSKIGILSSTKKMSKNVKKLIKILSSIVVSLEPRLKKDFIYFLGLPHVSRFFDYYEYLLLKSNNQDIMLTDTRDVVVQKNPFESNLNGLYLGMEDERVSIAQDDFHIKWISDVYGKKYLQSIGSKKICCAGVTLGDHASVMCYLEAMITEFMSLPYYKMVRSNYDQGIHNKLLYSKSFKNVICCEPLKSIISTIGLVPRNEIILNEHHQVLDFNGSISNIIHQYDRHKDIEKIFIKKYLN
ncbi:hypothetical protein KTI07_07000 [Acinetobacter lwoffii]|uniref:hypothetical protein n=1 Tax=Acinetobacter lwoffii TaxID=28090 RepID=UPI0021CDDEF9|nr:hypothetical protein [Acinetobacter lwoffii]MCU4439267.1 hypothetical protein [Acinetobacter lwoffii]